MRNGIFDLGGVVFDWGPDLILENFYDDARVRAAIKTALFQHDDWLEKDRGTLTELEVLNRLEACRRARSTSCARGTPSGTCFAGS